MKNVVSDVVKESEKFNNGASVRFSFCGYRDFGDAERFSLQDFVEKKDIQKFESLVSFFHLHLRILLSSF